MAYKLLEPIKIGKKLAKNRIVMAPMETRMSSISGDITQSMVDYYHERARGGTGTIIIENTFVDSLASRSSLLSSGLYCDHLIAGKNILAEIIKENGALAIIQLSHGGRQAREGATDCEPVGPSSLMCSVTKRAVHVLTSDEIIAIEDAFAQAAFRAKQAGFDGVEIHGAHGYLLCSFLSPLTNTREDAYGGSPENRARLAVNIIRKIRAEAGQDFIIGYRISASECIENGLEIEASCAFARSIEQDIDYIHVSAGIYESPSFWAIAPTYIPAGQLLPLASQMKSSVHIPVIAVGSLNPKMAEDALKKNDADLIAFGRALIADPFMPKKLAESREKDIRPCIRGNEGCISRFYTGCAIRCEVNPACGREAHYRLIKTSASKKVLVIGGGIAGMEAARLASSMGHDVMLVEKEKELGGHLIESTVHDFKEDEARLFAWIIEQVKKSDIHILLGTTASADMIRSQKPDLVILAIGSLYVKPQIPGAINAVIACEVLKDTSLASKKTVVIGGGLIGAETALALALEKKEVTLLEMTAQIAQKHEPSTRQALLFRLLQEKVSILTEHQVIEIGPDHVLAEDASRNTIRLDADTIVLATGLASQLKEDLAGTCANTVCIGDCVEPRKIYQCMHEAWHAVTENLKDADI
jgi:2,4-dienoyl-CoA reductase-like NADH-dependent reductase (Old Yellow Enzyme family)/thioredoxin reductase